MLKLVLLPGLDGTGELFAPFVNQLDRAVETQIISYSQDTQQTYEELTQYVLSQLPDEEFVLLAESFSGPIAYQIADLKPEKIKSLVVVASFLENPRPVLVKLLTILPSKLFSLPIPTMIIRSFFLGFGAKDEMIHLFRISIKKVSHKVIHFRLKEVLNLHVKDTAKKIHVPTIYIQATNDKLVPSSSFNRWKTVSDNVLLFQVQGEHFILQSKPVECAKIIQQEIDSLN